MAIKLTINGIDYTRHLVPTVAPMLDDTLNQSKILKFALYPADSTFNPVTEDARVRFFSDSKVIFTGNVTSTPNKEIVVSGYAGYWVTVQSDEYMFSTDQYGMVDDYVNQPFGAIFIDLIRKAGGDDIEMGYVPLGNPIPLFKVNPEWNFVEAAAALCTQIGYRWWILDKEAYLVPMNDAPYGYDIKVDSSFNTASFNITTAPVDVVKDATVIGQYEPQEFVDEEFIGLGLATSEFILQNNPYGDEQVETLYSDPFASATQSTTGFELGGELKFYHGTLSFPQLSNSVVGGLYDGLKCVAGFGLTAATVYTGIYPVVNGEKLQNTIVTKPQCKYKLYTYVSADEIYRYNAGFRAINGTFGGDTIPCGGYVTFVVVEVDSLGNETSTVLYDGRVDNLAALANYKLIDGDPTGINYQSGPIVDRLMPVRVRSNINGRIDGSLAGQTVTIPYKPDPTEKISVHYRLAGQAKARLVNNNVQGEIITIQAPAAVRTSQDCENLLQAYLSDHSHTLYEGMYVTNPVKLAEMPASGRFVNVDYPPYEVFSSIVTDVKLTFTNLENEMMLVGSVFGSHFLMSQYTVTNGSGDVEAQDFTKVPNSINSVSNLITTDVVDNVISIDNGRAPANFFEISSTEGLFMEPTGPYARNMALPRHTKDEVWTIRDCDGVKYSRYATKLYATNYPVVPDDVQEASVTVDTTLNFRVVVSSLEDLARIEFYENFVKQYEIVIDQNDQAGSQGITRTEPNTSEIRDFSNWVAYAVNTRGELSANPCSLNGNKPTPQAPTITVASVNGLNVTFNLTTENRIDIVKETLEVSDASDFSHIVLTDSRSSEFGTSTLALPVEGNYWARAIKYDSMGNSGYGDTLPFSVSKPVALDQSIPNTPTGVSVTGAVLNRVIGGSTATLNVGWTKSDSSNVAGYEIRYGIGTNYSYQQVGNIAAASISGLQINKQYNVAVCSINSTGGRSSYVTASNSPYTTPNISAPTTIPTGLTVTPAMSSIMVTWDLIDPSVEPDVTNYSLERSLDGSTWNVVMDVSGGTFSDISLNQNTTYYYRIAAVNPIGVGPYSTAVSGTTAYVIPGGGAAPIDPAGAPTLAKTLYKTTDGVLVATIDVTMPVMATDTKYRRIRIKVSGGNYATFETTDTVYHFDGLTPNTSYVVNYCNVSNINNASNWSADATITTDKNTTPPANPGTLTLTPAFSSIMVTWAANTTDADFGYFKVERAPDNSGSAGTYVVVSAKQNAPFFSDIGLTAGTKYWYRVTAYNTSDTPCTTPSTGSATTAYVGSTAGQTPAQPSAAPTATSTHGINTALDGTMTAYYEVDLGAMPADSVAHIVRVRLSTATNASSFQTADRYFRIDGLQPNTAYKVNYMNVGATGIASAASADLSITTDKNSVAPSPNPGIPAKIAGIRSIYVSWTACTSVDFSYYLLERSVDNGSTWPTSFKLQTPFYTDSGLSTATVYRYRVTTYNTSGVASTTGTMTSGTTPLAVGATAGDIAANSIYGNMIVGGEITGDKIHAGTITASNIQGGTITATELNIGSVVGGINSGTTTIDGGKITTGTIKAAQIDITDMVGGINAGTTTINGGNITTGTIKAAQIDITDMVGGINAGSTTISGSKITTGTITSTQIDASSIRAAVLIANSITAGMIASDVIVAANIQAGSITGDRIKAGDITGDRIKAGDITATQLNISSVVGGINSGSTTIDGGKITTNTITATQLNISSVVGGINAGTTTISGGMITTGTITATQINVSSISSAILVANAITAGMLAADSVTAAAIKAGEVTAAKLASTALTVGGTGVGNPGTLTVNNATGLPVGYIGSFSGTINGSAGTYYGGWFKTLAIGGTDANNALIYTDGTGAGTVAGSLGIGNTGQITVKDNSSNIIGYIGKFSSTQLGATTYGGWFKTLGIGGTKDAPKIYADASGNVTIASSVTIGASIPSGQVTGLGTLATQNNVTASQVPASFGKTLYASDFSADTAGRNVTDASTLTGQSIRAGEYGSGGVIYGPYLNGTQVPVGDCVVSFRMKVDSPNTSDSRTLCRIDVFTSTSGGVLAQQYIKLSDFKSNKWQEFSLDARFDATMSSLEFRVQDFRTGISGLNFELVKITPVSLGALALQDTATKDQVPNISALNGTLWGQNITSTTIDGSHITTGTVTANQIAANAIQTSNYVEDINGTPTAGAKLQTTGTTLKVVSGGFQLGSFVFTDYWTRLLNAIDGASGTPLVWRGNINTTINGGAPQISDDSSGTNSRLLLNTYINNPASSSGFQEFFMMLQPLSLDDNLDNMSYCQLHYYGNSSGTLVDLYDNFVPILSRRYQNVNSANGSNLSIQTFHTHLGGNWSAATAYNINGALILKAKLINVYGASSENYFTPPTAQGTGGTSSTGRWTNIGINPPSGLSGGTTGTPPAGGGGTGGGGCPAPWVKVQLSSGIWVDAVSLYNGAKVCGFDENDFKTLKEGTVQNLEIIWKERYAVVTADGDRSPEFSKGHRLAVLNRGWVEVQNLKEGDILISQKERIVSRIEYKGLGEVVSFQVSGCHTYFTDDILSHNAKYNPN